ncbi:4Fe-4S dicluster domain-containing protein [Methanosarcina sp. DH1]|uniref:4Fe-4S dicluster domain-containing protein n=1 Tax=Methanosarcina sp. DH1 TaxID=2605695 RepID=UPI001E38897C|nr:ferredoxin family protein [Methanosarcina sp. DH1]MCC4767762.1 4Fe-4S dicluster domain-containing protein [Methanosarcina sp. DH1]
MHPVIDYKKCTGALACYEVCPADVFDIEEIDQVKKAAVARPEDCIECNQCVEACPEDAIELVED